MTPRAEGDDHLRLVLHELRNPLVGIDAAARVLSRELGTHPSARRASAIASEARHLIGLLASVADADAAAAGRLRCTLRPVDLAALVRDAIAGMHLDGHPVSVRGAEAPLVVDADAGRVRQVLANLLSNAAQYSPAGSRIEVSVSVDARGHAVAVAVRDRGPGIPPRERRRLFRKFARLSTADGTRGSGLGLYICRAIVEDHGGTIRHTAVPGGGSCFTFAIPLTRGRPPRSRGAAPLARERGSPHATNDERRRGPRRATEPRGARPEATSAAGRAGRSR